MWLDAFLIAIALMFCGLWLTERDRRTDAERNSRIAQRMAVQAVQTAKELEFERDNAVYTALSQFGELNRVNVRNAELQRIVDGKLPAKWIVSGWSTEN